MKIIFFKVIAILSAISILSSCTHLTTKSNNISAIENKTLAVVISGCNYDYQTKLVNTTGSKQECIASWKNIDNGEIFSVSGTNSISFVKPGIYEFISCISSLTKKPLYIKHPDAISIFSKLIIKSGEVLYIGNLNINSTKSVDLLESIYFSQNKNTAKKYLKSNHPTLVNKMMIYPLYPQNINN